MKNRLIFAFFLAAASFSWACSGSSQTDIQVNSSASEPNKTAANVQADTFAQQTNRNKPADQHPILRFEQIAEDSQIAEAVNASGQTFQLRIWKKHPQLLKAEATWLDTKTRALVITLRTGQILNVTTDRIANLKHATAAQLLELAEVKPL